MIYYMIETKKIQYEDYCALITTFEDEEWVDFIFPRGGFTIPLRTDDLVNQILVYRSTIDELEKRLYGD